MKKTFKKKTAVAKQDKREAIADKIIEMMETHGADWSKPWAACAASGSHHNKFSRKAYRGINVFITGYAALENGFTSSEWGTFNQWFTAGGGERCPDTGKITKQSRYSLKGQKSTEILFWKKLSFQKDTDDGEKETVNYWKCRSYFIFNADQVEGYTPKETKTRPNLVEQFASVDGLVDHHGIKLGHGGDRAFYSPSRDIIQMPDQSAFKAIAGQTATQSYYGTLLHEIVHWSGHQSRLDRFSDDPLSVFGDDAYAAEELVAEIGSIFLASQLGIEKEPTPNHAKYLNGWIKGLKDNKKALFTAFSKAQAAADFIAGHLAADEHDETTEAEAA